MVRKKPVVVEALHLTTDLFYAWINGALPHPVYLVLVDREEEKPLIYVRTLEGDMLASIGDYLIRGVAGEYYPCRADIFEKTYEEVTT
jgi:hypothetical protein